MKRRAQLVCQHLENISREALEKHQEIIRQYVRGRHGVYALYRRNKFYYAGLTTDLRNRLKNHLKDRHGQSWDRFSLYFTIGDHHLRELEALLLRVLKPSGNRKKGKFAKSDDLRRRFRHDIKRSVMAEVDGLFSEAHPEQTQRAPIKEPDGRRPALAAYISGPMKLRALFKGKKITARVRRDGSIRFAGKIFTSPSLAAGIAVKRRICNGWTFWEYERAPGDWIKLDQLRK